MDPLTVVIQAGGESHRMGKDKALVPFLGRPLIERIRERVAPLADELLVTTNHPENFLFLNLPLVADIYPRRGALSGLYTALYAASQPLVAVIACDMPFANARLLAAERDWLASSDLDAVIPKTEAGNEPFHAVYRRNTCLPAILREIQAGKLRVDAWFSHASIFFFPPKQIQEYDPDRLAFWNVNSPEELIQAEQKATQIG